MQSPNKDGAAIDPEPLEDMERQLRELIELRALMRGGLSVRGVAEADEVRDALAMIDADIVELRGRCERHRTGATTRIGYEAARIFAARIGREFTVSDLQQEWGSALSTAWRYIERLRVAGVIIEVAPRRGRRPARYRFLHPREDAALTPTARHPTRPPPTHHARGPVPGTGRLRVSTDKDFNALIPALRAAGAEFLGHDAHGHFRVRLPSGRVTQIAGSPGDHRSLANLRALMRREGITF